MKTTILGMSVIAAIIAFSSCKKQEQAEQIASITASKLTAIKIGEVVNFKLSTKVTVDSVYWTVTPSSSVTVINSDSTTAITFSQKGQYTIMARSNGVMASQVVTVSDSVYVIPANNSGATTSDKDSTAVLSGDQIKITPAFDSTGNMNLNAVTVNSYRYLNNQLLSNIDSTSNNPTINYTGVFIPSAATGIAGQKQANTKNSINTYGIGTYNLTIHLNGITYNGSFTKSTNGYTFSWPYTSGVSISPLTITK